ncbi:hypothetical protein DL89DRAFT_265381 [Linderina pennispora]|uniref:Uncharacterized protein n=1 Tax=Linderina pennispora TaxID=61395 RepID=A0A1Y1WI89_9FUNG|nr:uncharacterized protein DL89DRAFT_265381 [Linderina pennispora]ORX73249.1 hypothetical protein DL89DRAFT_265381 [Linderina pennispora]
MAAAFVFNPMVMDFLRDYRRLRPSTRREHSVGQLHQHPVGLNFRTRSLSSYSSLELGSQLSLADLYYTQ